MKKRVKRLCKVGAFIVIFIICMHFLTSAFRLKDEFTISPDFYKYKSHSFDMVSLGSSLLMDGVSPMQMWEDCGISSYCLGAGAESIPTSYYLAKEAIERQHPKLIVLECGNAYRNERILGVDQLYHVTDTMPFWSMNRIRMIFDLADYDREALMFPFETYHMRWTDLSETDFQKDYKRITHGSVLTNLNNPSEEFERYEINTQGALGEIPMEYIDKLAKLCEDTDTQLLLFVMPALGPCEMLSQEEFTLRRNAAYAMEEYCQERNIDYLNLVDSQDVLGLDPSTDTVEGLHMNLSGAAKVTAYLEQYISKNYDLTDHRADPSYAYMKEALEEYKELYQEKRITTANRPAGFISALCDEAYRDRYITVLAEAAPGKSFSADGAEALRQLGISQDLSVVNEQAYAAVIDGGEVLYETSLEDRLAVVDEEILTDDLTVKVYSDTENENASCITIGEREYALEGTGLNILVFDKQTGEVVELCTAEQKGIR